MMPPAICSTRPTEVRSALSHEPSTKPHTSPLLPCLLLPACRALQITSLRVQLLFAPVLPYAYHETSCGNPADSGRRLLNGRNSGRGRDNMCRTELSSLRSLAHLSPNTQRDPRNRRVAARAARRAGFRFQNRMNPLSNHPSTLTRDS